MSITEGSALGTNTLAGLLRINDENLSDVKYNEVIQPRNLMKRLPFITSSRGHQHSWTRIKTANGSSFRDLYDGVTNSIGTEATVTMDLKTLDATVIRDSATILNPKFANFEQFLEYEAMKSLNQAIADAEYQFIQGTGVDTKGFTGLYDEVGASWGLKEDVGGAGGTRVYMLCLGEDDICGVVGGSSIGNEGNIEVHDPRYQLVDGAVSGQYTAGFVTIQGWMGMQIGGAYSAAVAYNIDGTSGKAVDDDLLQTLYNKFPAEVEDKVNLILMSKTGAKQLRDSRVTDLNVAPKLPKIWDGAGRDIPILVSSAMKDDETVVS